MCVIFLYIYKKDVFKYKFFNFYIVNVWRGADPDLNGVNFRIWIRVQWNVQYLDPQHWKKLLKILLQDSFGLFKQELLSCWLWFK